RWAAALPAEQLALPRGAGLAPSWRPLVRVASVRRPPSKPCSDRGRVWFSRVRLMNLRRVAPP
ncbi:unnamed protein product, partial [Amoebophrya sp. A120]